jgi:hypothetical protein
MTHARSRPSLAAEAAFRERLAELGAELLEPEWLGSKGRHRVRCAAGHTCYPRPNAVQQGEGICRTCAGNDPAAAEAAFRARLAELGAELLGPYTTALTPHHVRCAASHDCYPRPASLTWGCGICITCAGKDPAVSEAAFRSRLAELGATPLYGKWLGTNARHHVRCPAGHNCYPLPDRTKRGAAICKTCSGCDPLAAEAAFRARLDDLGAVALFAEYHGRNRPHLVRCADGHECRPRPSDVMQGHGVCRKCANREWDAFYVVASSGAVKFGVTSGDPRRRLLDHAAQGYAEVLLLVTGLSGALAPDTENAIRATLALAGEKPVRGREYFDRSCLALILDVAGGWLAASAA